MSNDEQAGYIFCVVGARAINKRMAMFLESLQSQGTSIRVWSLPRGKWNFERSESPTEVTRAGRWTADLGPIAGRRLNAVFCFHWIVLPIAILLGFVRRVPVLYDEHDHYELNTREGHGPKWKMALSAWLVRSIHRVCLPWVTLVTCIHQHEQTLKRHLERWQPRVLEIHNYPARVWHDCGARREPIGRLCFVYIGGVFREKGASATAQAWCQLPDDVRDKSELHFFGDGDADMIRELSETAGITVHHAVTPEVFRSFAATRRCCGLALLAGTKRYQLVGTNCTKLYEYLALGMPVIGTRVGEFPGQIEGHDVGLLIDCAMPVDELWQAMRRMIEDDSLFDRLALNASRLMQRPGMSWESEWDGVVRSGILSRQRAA